MKYRATLVILFLVSFFGSLYLPILALLEMGLGWDLHRICIGVTYFILRSSVYLPYPILCYFSVPEAEP